MTEPVKLGLGRGTRADGTPGVASSSIFGVDRLQFSYGDRVVLKELSFELGKGEVLGLLGPNGSGKSTAFGLISGLLAVQSGTLIYEGAKIASASRAMRRAMGVVFQSPSIDKKLTCRQNLRLAAGLHAIPKSEVADRVEAQLKRVGLTDRADDRAESLSGGMCRRLDIARALIHEPRLLVMDEPTAGLDEASFRGLWDRLERIRDQRELSILVATHRPEEAERCDRVMILNNGVVAASDPPAVLRAKMSSELLFLKGEDLHNISHVVRNLETSLPTDLQADIIAVDVQNDRVCVECESGHALIPRIVEAFPKGQLSSVELRQPSLADVFLKVTGQYLWESWAGATEPEDAEEESSQ